MIEGKEKVILWTAPRCMSTAFERAMMEISGTRCFHEPFSRAYYFGSQRVSKRYAENEPWPDCSYEDTLHRIHDASGVDRVFVKAMAYCVPEMETFFDDAVFGDSDLSLRNFRHTFLIRRPDKAISSLYKASVNPSLTGWTYFDPTEAGFEALFRMYEAVEKISKSSRAAIIIDADDLLADPVGIMRAYCDGINFPFSRGMLEWQPGPVEDWDVWPGWHGTALTSTGIMRRSAKEVEASLAPIDLESYPKAVKECVARSMEYYERLFANRLRLR